MTGKTIERQRVSVIECPHCGADAAKDQCSDSEGEFTMTACPNCAWVKIEDPDNPALRGEFIP